MPEDALPPTKRRKVTRNIIDSDDEMKPRASDLDDSELVEPKAGKTPKKSVQNAAERESNEPVQPIERSSIWYDDGNVILQAENTQFRVHKSILAKRSAVLRTILEAKQPAGQLRVYGAPVARLEDSEKDVHNLLSILYGDK